MYLAFMDRMIKQRFVADVLSHQGKRLLRNQGNALYKKIHFHTGELQSRRFFSVSGSDGMDGQLSFSHLARERFLDMKREVKGREGGTRRRSGYRIHNRFMYGHYFAIARELMVGLTDSVRESIRNQIKSEING